jgi:S-adenosylhomocysteine hydrolase
MSTATTNAPCDVRDLSLAEAGKRRIGWAAARWAPSMDVSFANQALSPGYSVPQELDKVAKLKFESMGFSIDLLTPEQEYLAGWSEGT